VEGEVGGGAGPAGRRLPVVADAYGRALAPLDGWSAAVSAAHPGVVPCRAGCSACCHGPFDISAADAVLIARALGRLAPEARAEVAARARRLVGKARALSPGWGPPFAIRDIGEDRFDALGEALADEPCPLLDDEGRCRIYVDRPLVCRLIGLPMATPAGRVLENDCPIQARFPAYAALPPQPFDLEALEEDEVRAIGEAADALFGEGGPLRAHGPGGPGYETFIAALVTLLAGEA